MKLAEFKSCLAIVGLDPERGIEPDSARKYEIELKKLVAVTPPEPGGGTDPIQPTGGIRGKPSLGPGQGPVVALKSKSYDGSVEVNAALAKSKLNTIADELIALLTSDPNAAARITLEIAAEFHDGANVTIKPRVSENAFSLNSNRRNENSRICLRFGKPPPKMGMCVR